MHKRLPNLVAKILVLYQTDDTFLKTKFKNTFNELILDQITDTDHMNITQAIYIVPFTIWIIVPSEGPIKLDESAKMLTS